LVTFWHESAQGPKRLVGLSLYRKYVRLEKIAVSVNGQKILDEKKYDGKYVLLTNTNLSAKETALAHKGLWQVERVFREIKSTFEIRPVYLSREDPVHGHVALCFLAFCLQVVFRKTLGNIEELKDNSFASLLKSLTDLRMVERTAGDKS
jgi:transposase